MQNDYSEDTTIIDYGYLPSNIISHPDSYKVVPFDSKLGHTYFTNSEFKKAFFKLAPHYMPQQYVTTCGIASAVIILNAVYCNNHRKRPLATNNSWYIKETDILYANYIWNEDNFFNEEVNKIINKDVLLGKQKINGNYHAGIDSTTLTKALNVQGLTAIYHPVEQALDTDIREFRSLLKQIMAKPTKYLIANYNLNVQTPEINSGHFSPIAAYDAKSDFILLLDPWAGFSPWIWISLTDFYKSMNTIDDNIYRGYILVDAKL